MSRLGRLKEKDWNVLRNIHSQVIHEAGLSAKHFGKGVVEDEGVMVLVLSGFLTPKRTESRGHFLSLW